MSRSSSVEPPNLTIYRVFPSGDTGGNVAGVVLSSNELRLEQMRLAAHELSLPTVAFARPAGDRVLETRMFTVEGEIASCGHAAAAVAAEVYRTTISPQPGLIVRSPGGEISFRVQGTRDRPVVTMALSVTGWSVEPIPAGLPGVLGVPVDTGIPIARATTGLTHLIVPVPGVQALSAIELDHNRWRTIGQDLGVDTIGVIAIGPDRIVHLRDICAPIGDTEEAASGTTASAVTWHLYRLGFGATFELHQGVDMGRPSVLQTSTDGEAVEVTGRASPIAIGHLYSPPQPGLPKRPGRRRNEQRE